MKIKISAVGGEDRGGGRHFRRIADVLNPTGVQIGDHSVGQTVHPILFAAATYIKIVLLCGRREVDDRHRDTSFGVLSYAGFFKGDRRTV